MKLKSLFSLFVFVLFIVMVAQSFTSQSTQSLSIQENFEMQPPEVERVTIQRILTPNPDSFNVVMRVKFNYYESLPEQMTFHTQDTILTLVDNGYGYDHFGGDTNYAVAFAIDISDFKDKVSVYEGILDSKTSWILFDGHNGYESTSYLPFDESGFDIGA